MKKVLKGKNLIFLILIGIFIFSFIKQEIVLKEIQKDVISKQDELQSLKKENKMLEEKIKIADTDEYIETLARERLDMVKPGEEVIKDKKGDSNSKN
ncbi:MAG: FtsB family cell division protein [Rickettsia sp.]